MDLLIGCRTDIPNQDSYYYHLEMTAEEYPTENQREELRNFLQPLTVEIIDEVVFLIDSQSGALIWSIPKEEQNRGIDET